MATFYLLIGPSYAGKSTWAKEQAEKMGAFIVSPSEIRRRERARSERAFRIAQEQIEHHLARGHHVVFDATNTLKRWRAQYIQLAKKSGAKLVAVRFTTPLPFCLSWQQKDGGKKPYITPGLVEKQYKQAKDNPPNWVEGFNEIWIVKPQPDSGNWTMQRRKRGKGFKRKR